MIMRILMILALFSLPILFRLCVRWEIRRMIKRETK